MSETGIEGDQDPSNEVTKLVVVIDCLIFIGLVILWSV